jgi:hypothetical protein
LGHEFFVIEENKTKAHKSLLNFIQNKIDDPKENCYKK